MPRRVFGLLLALSVSVVPPQARAGADPRPQAAGSLDDFESEPVGWKFVGGEEFPGAKGSLKRDTDQVHGGKGSYRLDADFRGGGAYVGCWKDIKPGDLPDVDGFRVWVRDRGLRRLGVRIVDDTGQCHQGSVVLPAGAGDAWREVALNVREIVGGEHWGGANDGRWHGPPKGLGLNIGKDSPERGGRQSGDTLDRRLCSAVPVAAGRARPSPPARSIPAPAGPDTARGSPYVTGTPSRSGRVAASSSTSSTRRARWSPRRTTIRPCRRSPGRAGSNTAERPSCRPTWRRAAMTWSSASGTPGPPRRGGGNRLFGVGPSELTALPGNACKVRTLDVSARCRAAQAPTADPRPEQPTA